MALLHHTQITAPGASPGRWVLFLHGLLGSGTNWRSFARRLVESDPGWGALLVDVRMHGASQGFDPPHTLDTAAADLVFLAEALKRPFDAVVGHSLGGKVALAYLGRRPPGLSHVLVLDADPGAAHEATGSELTFQVLAALEKTRFPFPTLKAFWDAMQAQGVSLPLAQWLGMNLAKREDGYDLAIDLKAMRALLDDYRSRDLWPIVEAPPPGAQLAFLLGGKSTTAATVRARLEAVAKREPRVTVTVSRDAGHWVHVDDPEGTFDFVRRILGTPATAG